MLFPDSHLLNFAVLTPSKNMTLDFLIGKNCLISVENGIKEGRTLFDGTKPVEQPS